MKRLIFGTFFIIVGLNLFSKEISKVDSLLNILDTVENSCKKAKILNLLSRLYWYSSPSKTLKYGKDALAISIKLGNDSVIIDSRINIGIGYLNMADYEYGMSQFMLSLSLSEKIGYKEGIANSLSNIATIYDYLGNYKKANEYYLKALELNRELKFNQGTIGTLNNLGILYTKQRKYDDALKYYNEALLIEKLEGEKQMMAITLANIGDVYDYNGDKSKALEYYRNSLQAGKDLESKSLIIVSMINIGRMKTEQNQIDSAICYFNNAFSISKDAGFRNFIKDIYFYISEAYDKKSDQFAALSYFKKYSSLKDSLLSEESNNKITELQVRYETEAKQKENDLLQKDNSYQKSLRNFFIAISILVIVLVVISYRNLRNKKKSNVLLLESNDLITKQKELLAESIIKLRESEELYRSLVTTSPDGIAITDLNARLTFVSPALVEMYGFDKSEQILGKSTLWFIYRDDWEKVILYFNMLKEGKRSEVVELKGVKSNKTIIDIDVNGGVLRNIDGQIIGLFFVFRDITIRKNIEIKNRLQQEMIYRQEQEISKLELLKKEQENVNLKNDLEFKEKDLTSKAMYIIQSNERIDSVVGKLKELERKAEEKERISNIEIRSLINDLKANSRRESWKEFETHFVQVHQSFYDNLLISFPELSSNERKLCAFLRLNLSTKEISEITGKSIHSLNVARTRLRQKLGIVNTEDNLSVFLSRF